ncbi:inactive transglutaminase family protein [Nitrosomonas communis]|uniref:inactive transglutaminase family protein n=1 Tax=Nitrosomonas communis TaxID=44574 RepID=UPI0026F1ABC3|nr:inactive transglutaminase family protein [Nitrosomonas communis]MCO6429082.1 inactive transglutaminase family protein [Nitrosomonas communis]
MRQLHLLLLIIVLCAIGLGLAAYKVVVLGLPLTPSEQAEVWNVEASISFRAKPDTSVKVSLPLPLNSPSYTIIAEDFIGANYGLAIEQDDSGRTALWAKRRAQGKQMLFYRAMIYEDVEKVSDPGKRPPYPSVPEYPENFRSVIQGLLDKARQQSADTVSFSQQVIQQLNAASPAPELRLLLEHISNSRNPAKGISWILAGARIPTRIIQGLRLEDGKRYSELESWIQVHDGSQWRALNIKDGKEGLPANFVIWQIGDQKPFSVEGGSEMSLQFSVAKTLRELVDIAESRAALKGSHIMEFSLYSLPVQSQNVYKILLMVPLGAFVVVLMRNLIGIKTFGTFMPVLIALALRETELAWGLILFCLIVGLGLLLRAYVDRLKLLLIPRLASVLTMVVLLMASTSVIMHKLGLEMGLSVALFPMVIMTMTIERMSLTWDEAGPLEAFKQGAGSLLVATIGYLVMNIDALQHLLFVFPELLLVVLAATLSFGRYSGYRLTELWRFQALAKR